MQRTLVIRSTGWIAVATLLVLTLALVSFVTTFQAGSKLVEAVAVDDTVLVLELLSEGHNIDTPGKDDWTALTIAIEKDNPQMVQLLIKHGADVNMRVPGGTPLDMAIRRQRSEIARLLIDSNGNCLNECDHLLEDACNLNQETVIKSC